MYGQLHSRQVNSLRNAWPAIKTLCSEDFSPQLGEFKSSLQTNLVAVIDRTRS
jgi:hypothetical protein